MPKKVLHIVGSMNTGGVEAWLMTLLRNSNKQFIDNEFLVHHKEKAFYDDEIYELGSQIHYCDYSSNLVAYIFNLYRAFKEIKPDVVHSHVHTFSGIVLLVAFLCGISIRISHSHSDTRLKENYANNIRRFYLFFMRKLISVFATKRLAVSTLAAECLYGNNWNKKKNCFVVMCGIDFSKYNPIYTDNNMRKNLNLPSDAYVLGHVGRFSEPKNHDFLIDVFYKLRQNNEKVYLVLVGSGELKENIEEKVKSLNLTEYIRFMGLRRDIPVIMLSVFDILVFPSLWEGLPLTLVEAQAANLKCLISKNITTDVDCGLVKYLSLNEKIWVDELELMIHSNLIDSEYNLLSLSQKSISKFDIKNCIKEISGFYE